MGAARHNSSTRHDGLDAINRLRKASVDGMCPEATPSASKEAPQWPWGLRRLPRWSSPTPRSTGDRVAHPPKTNQLPRDGLGVTKEWAQQGPPSKPWHAPISLTYGRGGSALEGQLEKIGTCYRNP